MTNTADIAAEIADLSIESKTLYAWLDERGYVAASDGAWSKGGDVFDSGDTMFQNAVLAACWELDLDIPEDIWL